MYQKMYEQAEAFFKPLSEVVSASQTAFETLQKKQTQLAVSMWQEGMDVAAKLAQAKDGQYLELQTAYWQGLSDKLSASAQDAFDYLQATNETLTSAFQGAWNGGAGLASASPNAVFTPTETPAPAAVKPSKIAAEPSAAAAMKTPKAKAPVAKVKD